MNTLQKPGHYDQPEHDEDGVLTHEGAPTAGQLALLNASEIGQQVATARRFPRSLSTFRKQIMDLVTLDGQVADSCIYALPRGGRTIEGPSVRFAEIMCSTWGNARAMSRVVHIDEDNVHAQGMFYDLEKNMAVTFEVMRRITNKSGKRYDQDMITVTGNAACAIAYRNAVLKGIPKAFWWDAYNRARATVAGDVTTLANKRAEALKAFAIFGVKPEQIFGLLGVAGAEDITTEHVVQLKGLHTAIKDGDTTPERAFAAENMKTAGQGEVPARPTKEDFKKADEPKQDAKPAEAKVETAAKPEPAKVEPAAKVEPEKKPDAPKQDDAKPDLLSGAKVDAKQGYKDYLADIYKELTLCKSVTKLDDLQERVERDLKGEAEDLKAFVNACNARARELQATKRK